MLSSSSRSSLSGSSNGKTTSATPKACKLPRNGATRVDSGSPSPVQKPNSTVPKPSNLILLKSKPTTKTSTNPEKPQHTSKCSELQAKLDVIEEDLKKARVQLAFVEQEKIQAIEELNEAKRFANETNEKLHVALVAKKKAEESFEIEKLRADELEQVGTEAVQKRECKYQWELESIRKQHDLVASALLSATLELRKVKDELANANNVKNTALSEAEKLNVKINALELELERAKSAEEKLPNIEALVEQLQMELTDVKKAESDALKQVDELKKKVASLEIGLEEANQSEKCATESLAIMRKKMEEGAALLQDAETTIATFKEQIESMEIEVAKYKKNLKESDKNLYLSQQEAVSLVQIVKILKSELKKVEEEKLQAVHNHKVAASDIGKLLEEKNQLVDELKSSRDEEEKGKKAMEGLASALHEISTEARENQERLLAKQTEIENAQVLIEQVNSALKNTEEMYKVMLDEARNEIVCLKKTVESFETKTSNLSTKWHRKELTFINAIKKSEDELAYLKNEMAMAVDSLKVAEQVAATAKADGVEMSIKFREAESAANAAHEIAEEAMAETFRLLQERLLEKENEMKSIIRENDDLRIRETFALQKIKELSLLHEEATAKSADKNSELPKSEKEYDHDDQGDDLTDIMSNNLRSEKDIESIDDYIESKRDRGSFGQVTGLMESIDYGATSATKNQQQKKKKALLHKFGSLLKKDRNKSHK